MSDATAKILIKSIARRNLRRFLIFVLVLLSVTLAAPFAHAYGPAGKGEDSGCQDGQPDDSGKNTAGKPINLFTGTESLDRTDLSVGRIYPITIRRSYNSSSVYDSQLGYGWSLNFDKRLYTYPDGSVTVRKDCGRKQRFIQSGGGFVPAAGDSGTLILNNDGTYTYTDKYGSQEVYDTFGRLLSLVDEKGNSLVLTYEADQRFGLIGLSLFSINPLSPFIVSYDYRISQIDEKDASGALTGAWVHFAYDPTTGRLNGIWDSTGRAVTYKHEDSYGNLTGVTWGLESVAYGYGDQYNPHHLVSINEGQGQFTNEYDAQGRVKKQTHGTGVLDIDYVIPGQKVKLTTTVKDIDSNVLNTQVRVVEFDGSGMVAKNTDAFGHVTIYGRDPQTSKITREEYWENTGSFDSPTLALKTATDYSYDARGNMLTKTEAQGTALEKTTIYTYDPVYSLVTSATVSSVVNPAAQKVTTNIYYPNGTLHYLIEEGLLGDGTPYSYTTTYDYYANGKLKSIDGPRTDVQDVTTYTYDPLTGYLTSVIQPLVGTTTYSNFDPLGNPQTVTDPNNNSTAYTYDTKGRVLTVTAAGDAYPTQYIYLTGGCSSCGGGGSNKIDHIIMPEGNTIYYHYDDGMGNLTSISDSAGNSINYTYDSEGNRLTEQIKDSGGALQKSLSYSYDALNRLKRIMNPDTNSSFTEYAYDFRGNRKSATDPNTNTTSYDYDELGRLKTVIQPGAVDTQYGYTTNNNLKSVTDDNGNTTTYVYDDKGRVYQVISPDTGTTTYTYDPAGNLRTKRDAKGVTITYYYDELNRLTTIDFPSDTDTVYTYGGTSGTCLNGKGRLCSVTDASGTTTYEYTAKGQVKKETRTIDTVQYVTQYTYDQNGNVKTIVYPSGKVIEYFYENDRVIRVKNGNVYIAGSDLQKIAYYPFGPMKNVLYGNGIAGAVGYDLQYRITGITSAGVMNLSYSGYDYNGNVKTILDQLDSAKSRSFTYDALDRLDTANGFWGNLDWDYDGVGNRTNEKLGGVDHFYTYPTSGGRTISNRLTSANGISFGYDSNGNTTMQDSRIYTYNDNQRLKQVSEGAMTANYIYNGNGQRVKKIAAGVTTIFHYSLNGQIVAESNSAGTITAEYVYLNGQPLVKLEGASTYYYHNDHLATPQKMTDSSGAVVWAADYKPFGEATSTVSTITNNLRFPGQYYDAETGLHYNYFRDYNSLVGRYLEADRIGLRGGINLYVYVRNRPINRLDPRGLMDIDPSGFYDSSQAAGPGNISIGGGYYLGGGLEFSWSSTSCCENNTQYTVEIFTLCGGGGVGAEGDIPVSIGVVDISSRKGCPRTRYYVKHETVFLLRSVNIQYDSQGWSAGISGGMYGISTSWSFCSDTVLSKIKTGCCPN